MLEALTRVISRARQLHKARMTKAPPIVPVDPMSGCPQCDWIEDSYGGHLHKLCAVHEKMYELQEELALEKDARSSVYGTLSDLHKVLHIDDEDDPVLVAKMRMEELADAARVEEGRGFWYKRYEAIRKVFAEPDKLPDPEILNVLSDFAKWPEDRDKGNELQRKVGLKAIPPNAECEWGAGVWFRVTGKREADEAARWKAEYEKSNAENNALRSIAATIMPCHYCGVGDLSKCPHGFPGCALADDAFCGEHSYSMEIQKLREKVKSLEGSGESDKTMADLENATDLVRLLDKELESLGVNSLPEVQEFLKCRPYYEEMSHEQLYGESPFKPGVRVKHADGRNGMVVGQKGSTIMWKPDNEATVTVQSDFRNLRLLPIE